MNPPQCCARIQDISKLAEDCCTQPSGLKRLAENGWIAAFAYFFAFMPWGIIYAFDFIGDRWKTIHKTRIEGIWHIVLTVIPLSYVIFYACLQFAAENYQEMSAALTAALLSVLHVARTIWGLIQLSVFEDWNFRALQCISNMGYPIKLPDGGTDSSNIGGSAGMDDGTAEADRGGGATPANEETFCSEKKLRRTVAHRMIVNNTLIDNVFYGADLPVRLSCLNGAAAKNINSRGSLTCRMPEKCTIRWSVAFLARFGSQWLTDCKPEISDGTASNLMSTENEKRCFRFSRNLVVFAFLHVTGYVERQHFSLVSPGIRIRKYFPSSTLFSKDVSDSDSCFPYKSTRKRPNLNIVLPLTQFKHIIRDARSCWDTLALDEGEYASVSDISEEQLASFLYIFDKNPRSSADLDNSFEPAPRAEALLMRQLNLASASEFSRLEKAVPIRTASFYVPLWPHSDQFANRLVLQASTHVDNWLSLNIGEKIDALAWEAEQAADGLVFERQRDFELDRLRSDSENTYSLHFLGSIMETVRSKIAEWIKKEGREDWKPDWTPDLPQPVWFPISSQLEHILQTGEHHNRSTWMRLLWEAQSGMEKELNGNTSEPHRTMEKAAVLCILGFPSLTVEERSPTSFLIFPKAPPQNIHLLLSVDNEGGQKGIKRMKVETKGGEGNIEARTFHWARWRDAFFGRLSAQSTWRKNNGMPETDALANHPTVSLRRPIREIELRNADTRDVQRVVIWDGWPPHNPQIAFFEISQILKSPPRGSSFPEARAISNATAALRAGLANEVEYQSSQDTSMTEHSSNVFADYEKALKRIEENRPGEALELLSPCVKQFAHALSLQEMFGTVFRNNNFEVEKVRLLIDAMCCGMERLSIRSIQEEEVPYLRFTFEDLGLLFGTIHSKTGISRALEYKGLAFLRKSKISEPVNPRAVDAFQQLVEAQENLIGIARANLFLAICFQRNYLASQRDDDSVQRDDDSVSGRDAELASTYLLRWGMHVRAQGRAACSSTGFLFEKGSCYGRDEHRLFPVQRLFDNDPIVKALLTEQFISKTSLNRVTIDLDLSSFPDPKSLGNWLQEQISSQITNGVEPDKKKADDLYCESYVSNFPDMSHQQNITPSDLNEDTKPFAWNRQVLMKLENLENAKFICFDEKDIWDTRLHSRSMSACRINYGAVLQLATRNRLGLEYCQEAFERARNACLRPGGSGTSTAAAAGSVSPPTSSPRVTAANNLAVVTEQISGSAAAEVAHLYEEAEREAHPVGMYNYAVYLICGPERNLRKALELLDQVLDMGNELIPMYNLISQAMFLRKRLQENNFDAEQITWNEVDAIEFDEIDDCLASVKCIEYATTENTGSPTATAPGADGATGENTASPTVDFPEADDAETENMSSPTEYDPGADENV